MGSSYSRQTYIGMGLATLTALIWSGNFIIAKDVFHKVPPVSLAFFRWTTATIILFPFAYKRFAAEWRTIRQHLPYFTWVALTGVSLFNTLIYIGAGYTSAINMALIGTGTSPIVSVLLARIFLKEKISWAKIAGMLLCIAGIIYLLSNGSFSRLLSLEFSEGDLWALTAALAFSFYNVLVKKKPEGISTGSFLFTSFFIGTAFLIPFFIAESMHTEPIQWNGHIVFAVLYLGIGASVISFFLWNLAISRLGAGRTALFGNLIPIFSSIEAVLILHEAFTASHLISMALVFAGLVIANINKKPSKPGN